MDVQLTLEGTPRKRPMRADKEQSEARVNELLRILLDGAQKWDFTSFVREKEAEAGSPWYVDSTLGQRPLTYSQIRRYVTKAKQLILTNGGSEREELLKLHMAKRDHLYAKAVAQGDVRTALAVLDSQAKLQKLVIHEHAGANGEAFFPSLSAMVFAIIKHETVPAQPIQIQEVPADEQRGTGITAAIDRGEAVPRLAPLLRDELLQDTCVG